MIAKYCLTDHPILAHIIPMRRCNLSCTYCNEYDDYSQARPAGHDVSKVRSPAALGTTIVTISGGANSCCTPISIC